MNVKLEMRDWQRTFDKYVQLRTSKTRQEITHQKAVDFAFKAFQNLPPTDRHRIQSEMAANNLLLKLAVKRLQAKGVQLKGLPSVKVKNKHGGKRTIPGVDKLISQHAKKILRSKLKSVGYHRVAYVLLARKLGAARQQAVNPRSILNRTNVQERHSRSNDVYTLNAVARGMDCPSTHEAVGRALTASRVDMQQYIDRKLNDARKTAGFK